MNTEHEPVHEPSEDRFRQVVYAVAAAATLTYGGWLGLQVTQISAVLTERLTRIETTISENRSERQFQIQEINRRIERLEARVYEENGRAANDL